MSWMCGNCGKEHPASRTTCKQCGSRDIQYTGRKSNTVSVGGAETPDPLVEIENESSPDVNTDGSLAASTTEDAPKESRQVGRRATKSARSGVYKLRAYILAPFHILWMYKQAILAFLLVFCAAYYFVFI